MSTPRIIVIGAPATVRRVTQTGDQLGWSVHAVPDLAGIRSWEALDAIMIEAHPQPEESALAIERAKLTRPGIACISVVSGLRSQVWVRGAHGSVHIESDALTFQQAFENAQAVLTTVAGPEVRRLIGHPEQLPVIPRTFLELRRLASRTTTTVEEIAAVIGKDPAIATQVLKLANSATFGGARRIASIQQAVGILGLDALSSLVLSAQAFSAIAVPSRELSLERFQQYSVRVARVARVFLPEDADNAFAAGLLHDIGNLILGARFPREFANIVRTCALDGGSTVSLERELLGIAHAEVGAYVLDAWHLPFSVVEAVAAHEKPTAFTRRPSRLVATVHAAQALMGIVACGAPESTLDRAYIEHAGLTHHLAAWRALVEAEVAAAF